MPMPTISTMPRWGRTMMMRHALKILIAPALLLAGCAAEPEPATSTANDALTADTGLSFNGVSFNGMLFNGVSFNGVSFNGVSFNGVSFNGVSFNGVSFNGTELAGATMTGVLSTGATLGLRVDDVAPDRKSTRLN